MRIFKGRRREKCQSQMVYQLKLIQNNNVIIMQINAMQIIQIIKEIKSRVYLLGQHLVNIVRSTSFQGCEQSNGC